VASATATAVASATATAVASATATATVAIDKTVRGDPEAKQACCREQHKYSS
jgi:hypothetical protein